MLIQGIHIFTVMTITFFFVENNAQNGAMVCSLDKLIFVIVEEVVWSSVDFLSISRLQHGVVVSVSSYSGFF